MSSLEVLVPRGLIEFGQDVVHVDTTKDGLCPCKILVNKGRVAKIEGIKDSSKNFQKLLLPRFVEPHAHLDKAFTWSSFPNLEGTYEEALKLNLQEHTTRTRKKIFNRFRKSLKLATKNGLRAIRSHIDGLSLNQDEDWQLLFELRKEWKQLIDLQFVALFPLEYWSTSTGVLLAQHLTSQQGCLGGVVQPPFNRRKTLNSLSETLLLANKYGLEVDLHIDETYQEPGAGLELLLKALESVQTKVPITCSHLSSMSLLPTNRLKHLADRLAHYEVNVVALPLTNFWLLGRKQQKTPVQRPIAPISQLQKAGVNVAIGGDNVQDPWFPFGDFDSLRLMAISMPMLQLEPWRRLGLSTFTTAPAHLMNLEWDGVLGEGKPADFVVIDACNWAEAFSLRAKRKIMIKGNWLEDMSLSVQLND